jgi:hypothetical protein
MKSSTSLFTAVLAVCAAGCGHAAAELPRAQAVGTYIGAITPDCTYTGPALASDATGAPGRRFAAREGEITVSCRGSVYTIRAVNPTSATISGPDELPVGKTVNENYVAHLAAPGFELDNDPFDVEWSLGADCLNHAEFAPVMGAQDTGGRERFRHLVVSSPGTCTLKVSATTGSSSYESFIPQTFRAEKTVKLVK